MVTPMAMANKIILTHQVETAKNADNEIVPQSIEIMIIFVLRGMDLSSWKFRTMVPKYLLLITLLYNFSDPRIYNQAVNK